VLTVEVPISVNKLKATQASLQSDLARLKEIPTASQIKKAAQHGRKELSLPLQELNLQVAEVEEKCVLYRTAGWTVFEMDLDIGRRGRKSRTEAGEIRNQKEVLGLGIRLETYCKGRFYEPFYLIFAKPSQEVSQGAEILNSSGDDTKKRSNVRLLRHTIPHFVPLSDIMQSHLRPSQYTERDSGAGGLELLEDLMQRDSLMLFLCQLHTYLQSFVNRREQALALTYLELPGTIHSSLQAFSNDSFGQISIRWDLPNPTSKDLKEFEQSEGILYPNNDGFEAERYAKEEGELNTALEISIVYHDLSSDKVGVPAKEVSKRRQLVEALGNTETPGLKCTFATILIESIRSKIPAARRGTSNKFGKLQVQRIRRTDWELLFTRPQESLPELEEALRVVSNLAWKEEMERVILSAH